MFETWFSASAAKHSLVHSYGRSFNGFAAKLTAEEAARVSGALTNLEATKQAKVFIQNVLVVLTK